MKTTQCQRILDYMQQFGSISSLEAFNDLGVVGLQQEFTTCVEQDTPLSAKLDHLKTDLARRFTSRYTDS